MRIVSFAVREFTSAASPPSPTAPGGIVTVGQPLGHSPQEQMLAATLLPDLSDHIFSASTTLQNSVRKISDNFSDLAKTSRQAVESAQGGLHRYGDSASVLDEIESGLEQIDEMAEVAHVVSINAQIESTRPIPSREAFMALATETSRLSEQCKTASRRIGEVLQKVRSLQESMLNAIAESGTVNRELEQQISQAVIGLQFQDPLTQQLNSIGMAVTAIQKELNSVQSWIGADASSHLPERWKGWFESLPAVTSGHPLTGSTTEFQCGSVELF
ncbi:MAG: hypothetical protein U0996_21760 [Planctomycetaceae bacterium]